MSFGDLLGSLGGAAQAALSQRSAMRQQQIDAARLQNNPIITVSQMAMAQGQSNMANQMNLRPGGVFRTQGDPARQFMHEPQGAAIGRHQRHTEMTYMGQEWPRQPIPIRCDGWVSDTLTLQRHGYEFKVERDMDRQSYRIAIGKAGARSMIMIDEFHYEEFMLSSRPLEFHGEFITTMEVRERIIDSARDRPSFVSVDMNDAYWCEREVMYSNRRLDVRDLFPQSDKADDDSLIILPDKQSMAEALDIILEKQAPRMEEIKRNQKRRDVVEKTHATLVTLEEVA